jgi:putative ABC transport system permease protein
MSLWSRLVNVIRGDRLIADIDEELESHIAEAIAHGRDAEEARRAFGGSLRQREASRDIRHLTWLADFLIDLRRAVNAAWRHRALTSAVVGSLALGMGVNTAIFSLGNSLILKSLPVEHSDRLVRVTPGGEFEAWTYPLWEQLQAHQAVLDGVFAWSSQQASFDLSTGGAADLANGLWVSASFFDVLGVRPILGRAFVAADDRRGGGADGPVAVVSHSFWQRHFHGAVDAVGATLLIERVPFTVVGVTPPDFFGPQVGSTFDVAIPIGTQPLVLRRDRLDQRTWWWLQVMGRLKPGQAVENATAGLAPLQPILRDLTRPSGLTAADAANYLGSPMTVTPAPGGVSELRSRYQRALTVLMAVAGLVLLIACVNVANLMFAHGERRRPDVSLQVALGASRSRLIRQLLAESLVLSVLGAVAGLLMSIWAGGWLVAQLPAVNGAPYVDLSIDWRVLGFTGGVAIAVALLFGTAPAFRATRVDPMQALKQGRGSAGHRPSTLDNALVAFQVSLCLVLVVAAGLFVRTFTALTGQDAGVDRERVIVVAVDARHSPNASAKRKALYDRILVAVRALPGVADAAYSSNAPMSNNSWNTVFEHVGPGSSPIQDRSVLKNEVSPQWFSTYGISVIAGRDFSVFDQRSPQAVVIVNETFARRYFDGDPIGRSIREVAGPDDPQPDLTIVGVARDAVYTSLREGPPATMYLPSAHAFGPISVRAESESPAHLMHAVIAAITDIDGDLKLSAHLLADDFSAAVARERLLAVLAALFGGLALLLAGVGLYGVVSYGVGARRTEIGIRMSLGASRIGVVGLIVRRVAALMCVGVAAGVAISLLGAQYVSSLLFGVSAHDPATLVVAMLALASVGLAAAWIPAQRAASINPTRALRAD